MSNLLAELLEETGNPPLPPTELEPNKQLFVNNPLSASAVAAEVTERPDSLYAAKPPNLAIQSEKPIHRSIVFLKAEGLTNREIADRTGYTEAWVSQITRQPWFQKALLDELKKVGRTSLHAFLEVQAHDTALKLVHLRDNASSESVQLSACNQILDRFLGKPIARTEQRVEVHTVEERVSTIDLQIQNLEAEEKRLLSEGRFGSESVEQTAPTDATPEGAEPPNSAGHTSQQTQQSQQTDKEGATTVAA